MHTPIPYVDIAPRAANVPTVSLPSVDQFAGHSAPGALKYEAPLGRGINLEALLLNKQSDTLIVAFHGAVLRTKTELPMFERLTSFGTLDESLMIFSDPTLRLADNLDLSWYTGWDDMDPRPIMAEWATRAAAATGAKRIVFWGSSGGGFASLQVSSYAPGSIAVAMNPQIELNGYLVEGTGPGPLRRYVNVVWPHLAPVPIRELDDTHDWHSTLGDRVSVAKRYENPIDNRVLFVQNRNDHSHIDRHHGVFKHSVENGPNREHVVFDYYDGPSSHAGPSKQRIFDALNTGLEWAKQ